MPFTCIYCKNHFTTGKASESHIIPASMGGPITLLDAVCGQCNLQVAKQVEDPFKDSWAWLLWWLDVKGRRGKPPPFKGTMNILGRETKFTIRSRKRAPEIPPIFDKGSDGKERVQFIGPPDYVSKKQSEYSKKHPKTVWADQETASLKKSDMLFPIDIDSLDAPSTRRLAAKVAFEFWGLKRAPNTLLQPEYDAVREFVRWGTEGAQPLSGLIADEILISKNLNISFPNHAISVVAHSGETKLGAIVVLFGLFYYWVVLNPRYPLRASMSELTVMNPVGKTAKDAVLVGSARVPRIPWERLLAHDPDLIQKAWNLARGRMEKSIEAARKH